MKKAEEKTIKKAFLTNFSEQLGWNFFFFLIWMKIYKIKIALLTLQFSECIVEKGKKLFYVYFLR